VRIHIRFMMFGYISGWDSRDDVDVYHRQAGKISLIRPHSSSNRFKTLN